MKYRIKKCRRDVWTGLPARPVLYEIPREVALHIIAVGLPNTTAWKSSVARANDVLREAEERASQNKTKEQFIVHAEISEVVDLQITE